SADGGGTWTRISGLAGSNLPTGDATDLVADPGDSTGMRFYAGIPGTYSGLALTSPGRGVFRTIDGGLHWTAVNTGLSLEKDKVDNDRDGTVDEPDESIRGTSYINLAVHN